MEIEHCGGRTVSVIIFCRLSVDIGATEEILGPESSKFREGHTKVSDVEKIYLTGPYKQKYRTISDYYNSTPQKGYPILEWSGGQTFNNNTSQQNGRKVRSAYPNVRLRSAHLSNNLYNQSSPSRVHVKEITVKSSAVA